MGKELRCDGIEGSETKRLKALEAEKAKLNRFLGDALLYSAALEDLLLKNCETRREA